MLQMALLFDFNYCNNENDVMMCHFCCMTVIHPKIGL